MTEVSQIQTMTLDELQAIEDGMSLLGVDALLAKLRAINTSDRSFRVTAADPESFQLSKRHVVVAEKVMNMIDTKTRESMKR